MSGQNTSEKSHSADFEEVNPSAHKEPGSPQMATIPNAPNSNDTMDTTENSITSDDVPKKRKSVGFAPEPEEDLKEHHKYLEERKKDKLKSNPFWRIPAELAYLEPRMECPKPLPMLPKANKPRKPKKLEEMKDLPTRAVKEISVVNKYTSLNFYYHEINIPIGSDRILVDVQYASLSSFDLSKFSKYLLNMTNTRVGLGYDYVGEIIEVGSNFLDHPDFKIGTLVYGVTNPLERKGALQSLVIINPRDIIIPISADQLEIMKKTEIQLSFSPKSPFLVDENDSTLSSSSSSLESGLADNGNQEAQDYPEHDSNRVPKSDPYEIKGTLPTLAKFCCFSAQFCRAKQSLDIMDSIFKKQGHANILINGADTELGYTIIQLLSSSIYSEILQAFNVILVVLASNLKSTRAVVSRLASGGMKKFHVISFDVINESTFPRDKKEKNCFKKVPFFASELFECMFGALPASEQISKSTIDRTKLDLFIDIIGSKKMFQKPFDMNLFNDGSFPFKSRLAPGLNASSLLGDSKEQLFTRILKPKNAGSCYVSYCKFSLSEPSYQVEKLVDYGGKSLFDPWSMKWSSDLANLLVSKYNYYEKFDLEIRHEWVEQALQLVLNGELKMKVDEYVDWRSNFRKYIDYIKNQDGQVVFKIEAF